MEIIEPAKKGLQSDDIEAMKKHLDTIVSHFPNHLGALVIVGIGTEGSFSRATRIAQDGFIGETLLPAMVGEILRRDVSVSVADELIRERL